MTNDDLSTYCTDCEQMVVPLRDTSDGMTYYCKKCKLKITVLMLNAKQIKAIENKLDEDFRVNEHIEGQIDEYIEAKADLRRKYGDD